MDASGLLGLLVVVVLFDTLAIGALLVLTVRRPASIRLDSWSGRDRGAGVRAATAASQPASQPANPPRTTLAATTAGDAVEDAARDAAGDAVEDAPPLGASDPLADAISAFLGRSDGIFRTGVSAAPTGAALGDASPATGASAAVESAPAAGRQPVVPGPVSAPIRPSRYVASGTPRPAEDRTPAELPEAAAEPATADPGAPAPPRPAAVPPSATTTSGVTMATPIGGPALVDRSAPRPSVPSRPATRLTANLVGLDRQPSIVDEAAQVAAAARLSPVIAGLLRERSRTGDQVRVDGPGRFSLDLPDTTTAGAGALAGRLLDSCEAWLAAELPPLRLDLALADLTGREVGPVTATARPSGPERRRLSTLNA